MIEVYVEAGSKRVFAGALAWPGWCRSARDEEGALEALLAYAPRYARAVGRARLRFAAPRRNSELRVIERLRGDSSTDFGAPGAPPAADARPAGERELARIVKLLEACWTTFDTIAEQYAGASLRTGPRGGGRSLAKIRDHVLDADAAYLGALGAMATKTGGSVDARLQAVREDFVEALGARDRGELPERGPRGGKRWTARYAARRSAWHALDHAWEIEDRVE